MSKISNIKTQALKVLNRDSHFYREGSPEHMSTRRSNQFILTSEEYFKDSDALGFGSSIELEYLGLELGTYGNYLVQDKEQRNNSILYFENVYIVVPMEASTSAIFFRYLLSGETIIQFEIHQLARLGKKDAENRLVISMTHTFNTIKILTCEPNYNTNLIMVSFSYVNLTMTTHAMNEVGDSAGQKIIEYSTYTTVDKNSAEETK